jgi:hypothetical protein
MRQMMDRLKFTVNEEKTRICRVPDGEFAYPLFLDSGSADNQTLGKDCVRCASKPTIWTTASIRRSLAVEVTINNPISREELVRIAIKLRNDLFDYEDKLGSCRDFVELKNSAGALAVAILEPVEFRLSACPPKKAAQVYQFPPQKGSIPHSLH